MTERTDTHKPSAIIPEDYQFVAFDYIRIESLGEAPISWKATMQLSAISLWTT